MCGCACGLCILRCVFWHDGRWTAVHVGVQCGSLHSWVQEDCLEGSRPAPFLVLIFLVQYLVLPPSFPTVKPYSCLCVVQEEREAAATSAGRSRSQAQREGVMEKAQLRLQALEEEVRVAMDDCECHLLYEPYLLI